MMDPQDVKDADIWKSSDPYLPLGATEDFEIRFTATCMCGKVEHAVDSDPVVSKFCHCTSCQILHGMYASQACDKTAA